MIPSADVKGDKLGKQECVKFNENGDLLLSTSQMGKVFNMRPDTLSNWADKGCPKEERGWWNVREVVKWRGLARKGDNEAISDEARKLQAEADYKVAKARQAEVELQEQLGNLVPIEMISAELNDCFAEIRQLLLRLPTDVYAQIHSIYPQCSEGVSEIADDTVRKCLLRLAECNNGRNTQNVDKQDN